MNRVATGVIACACITIACDRRADRTTIVERSTREVTRVTAGTPHGSEVERVALTERGDAALTADRTGGARLWPTLDGTREPVMLDLGEVRGLALAQRDDELVAAAIDSAGIARVMRLGRDGAIHARATLAGDVPVREIVAINGDLLVRRSDQTVERVDADGIVHGRLEARPGERIGAIAVRGGGAIALVGDDAHLAKHVRWIDAGEMLTWGADIALPVAVRDDLLALSPNRGRIAVGLPHEEVAARIPTLAVYALGANGATYVEATNLPIESGAAIGFTDDDHVAVLDAMPMWWSQQKPDPWLDAHAAPAQQPPQQLSRIGRAVPTGAVADGVAAFSSGSTLALASPEHTRYLGWRELALGNTIAVGDEIGMGPVGVRTLWLDRGLHEVRAFDAKALGDPQPFNTIPIDAHHAVVEATRNGKYWIRLVDIAKPDQAKDLGEYETLSFFQYSPARHVLALANDKQIDLLELDLEHDQIRRLPPLAFENSLSALRLLDPARAGGATALAAGWVATDEEMSTQIVETFRANGSHRRESVDGNVIAMDDLGSIYIKQDPALVVRRGGRQVARFVFDDPITTATASRAGDRVVVVRRLGVYSLDPISGAERWHHTMLGVIAATFTSDERHVIVRTTTAVVTLDADTGEPTAIACGWGFGLHDEPIAQTYGVASLCEDGGA